MNVSPSADYQQSLEEFRQLLFHLQMQCGSIHDIFRFFKEEESMEHFEALKAIDPNLMSQLLAREYVLEARNAANPDNARTHLETALQLDPKCPEAMLELAAISDTPEGAMKWYHKCMEFTKSELGEERFSQLIKTFKSNPWQQVELHTFLKAKASLAEKLFRQGFYNVAALHFEEMLEWNPSDEINLHHYLMTAYLCEDRVEDAVDLRNNFRNDLSAQWYYHKAFLQYKLEGNTRRSNRLLMRAFKRNLWAAVYVLGLKEMPATTGNFPGLTNAKVQVGEDGTPEVPFKEGGRREAVECVRCIAPAIFEDEKLAAWVWDLMKGMV